MWKNNQIYVRSLQQIMGIVLIMVLLALVVIIFTRIQRGYLGLIMTGLAIALAFFWVREIRKMFTKRQPLRERVEMQDEEDRLTITAELPDISEVSEVTFSNGELVIVSPDKRRKVIKLKNAAALVDYSFVNSVLHAKLLKKT